MSRGCHHTTVSLNFCSPLVFRFCPPSRPFLGGKASLSCCLFFPSAFLICLKRYSDEESSISMWVSLSSPVYPFLSHVIVPYLDLFLPLTASHHLPSSLSSPLCGRVVINPYFIAGEFLCPCRADSSPLCKTLQGPNTILPPSITPSLPPSGPDY